MTENEFLLEDRLQKIRQIIGKYGEDKFLVSFSGGKDSTVLSALVDMAIPDNKIPRVYANTGIDYRLIVEFVEREREREHLWELVIIKPITPIKQMLEKEGYPFKSKGHSEYIERFRRSGKTTGVKQYLGEREDKEPWSAQKSCPKCLKYQFTDEFTLNVSDKCCIRLKEDPVKKWQKENGRPYAMLGLMPEEGGRRTSAKCLAFKGKRLNFQPLVVVTKAWEDWFIKEFNIDICDLYKPPYNFDRTGCKGCPFAPNLQEELDVLEKYFPAERKQCEFIWKPVYDEYRRLGYRLKKPYEPKADIFENDGEQLTFFDYYNEDEIYEGGINGR